MSDELKMKTCPECGGELVKEPYEDYLYCPDCGWDAENGNVDADMEDVGFDDADLLSLDDEELHDPNLDPEAGESA